MSEKFCLKWNDFQTNTTASFGNLRNDNDFADVTLATEDDQQIEVHKVVLSAGSPFFNNVLKKNKHPHPLIYMKNVKSKDLAAIVDFMYFGEVNILQEDLDQFLSLADEIKLLGLSGGSSPEEEKKKTDTKYENAPHKNDIKINTTSYNENEIKIKETIPLPVVDNSYFKPDEQGNELATINEEKLVIDRVEDLDGTMESVMEKQADGMWRCNLCGKIPPSGKKNDLRKHVESRHTSGISHPCNKCGKTYRLKRSLNEHISKIH